MKRPGRRTFIVGVVLVMVALVAGGLLGPLHAEVSAKGKPDVPPGKDKNTYTEQVQLQDIDSGLTSPTGDYRWLDVADQAYSATYRDTYDYTQANVKVAFNPAEEVFKGLLTANNLKPNFAYQVKLGGDPIIYPTANENIGLKGRWWRETWDGSEWTSGTNSTDADYLAHKDDVDLIGGSPTGFMYKYTGYLVFDYFTTDGKGNASLSFEADSSYHVLWKTTQSGHTRTASDGPIKTSRFKVNAKSSAAYDTNYGWQTVSIYGEVERTPVGGVYLDAGTYNCEFFLTEESFHGSGGAYAGNWAAAMGAPIEFQITE